MSVSRPSPDAISAAAHHFGITLDAAGREEFTGLVDGALGSYDVVDELYQSAAPSAPHREHRFLADDDNALGAWYVATSITAQNPADDRLAGKRIAIKDNVAVAGVPMMNGSRTLEGFVPSRDATVVTRLLAAGAEVAGKSVCEDLCFFPGRVSLLQPGRCTTRGILPVKRVDHPAAAGLWSPTVTSTWLSGATRADRSVSRLRSVGWSGTSRRSVSSPTPVPSRSNAPSIILDPSHALLPTPPDAVSDRRSRRQ